jgi:hypothetical protein
MRQRVHLCWTLYLTLLVCGVGFSTLAYATPPDPTWIDGIYDAADFDDVVWALSELCISDQPTPSSRVGAPQACGSVAETISARIGSVYNLSVRPRSPPLL